MDEQQTTPSQIPVDHAREEEEEEAWQWVNRLYPEKAQKAALDPTAKAAAIRLFRTQMWREYAAAWERPNRPGRLGREWMVSMKMPTKEECLKRAREALSKR